MYSVFKRKRRATYFNIECHCQLNICKISKEKHKYNDLELILANMKICLFGNSLKNVSFWNLFTVLVN